MHVSQLSDDVVYLLLWWTIQVDAEQTPQEWQEHLVYMSICQRWRAIGKALAYRKGMVVYGQPQTTLQLVNSQGNNEPQDAPLATNLDLAAATQSTELVRTISISVHYLQDPFPGIYSTIALLHRICCHWPRVHRLELAIKGNHRAVDKKRVSHACLRYADEVVQSASALTMLMPNLSSLSLGSATRPMPTARALYGQLAGALSAQLTSLSSSYPILVPQGQVLHRLTHLDISLSSRHGGMLAFAHSDSLVFLSLTDMPLNFCWTQFSPTTDSPRVIEFGNLNTLKLTYRDPDDSDADEGPHNYKLEFPRMERLHIATSSGSYYPVLEHSVFPWRLHNLHLDGSIWLAHILDQINLPQIQSLSLNLYSDLGDIARALASINALSSRAQNTTCVRLEVFNQGNIRISSTINCPVLTALDFKAPICYSSIRALVAQLPGLRRLDLNGLLLPGTQPARVAAELAAYQAGPVPRLESHITALSLAHCPSDTSQDGNVIGFIQLMVLLLPELRFLQTRRLPAGAISTFVADSTAQHPRLGGMELNLQ